MTQRQSTQSSLMRLASRTKAARLPHTLAVSALALAACGNDDPGANATTGSTTSESTTSVTSSVTTTGPGSMSSSDTSSSTSSSTTTTGGGAGTGEASTSAGGAEGSTGGVAGATTSGGGTTGGGTGGTGGTGAPEMLSETGLFTERGSDGELVLAEGVRQFEPKYWLWSDGSDKRRYVYLPPGTQIDTSNPDSWILPAGAKLWKSFIAAELDESTDPPTPTGNMLLVETRLIERTGDGPSDYRFATYWWPTADAADATLMPYEEQLLNAGPTNHDIPNGYACERCHGASAERALGFSALQLNHDTSPDWVNLETLVNEDLLTEPISLDIQIPAPDQETQDALGYLHANCGNCHNDNTGVPVENIPEPQLLLKVKVDDIDFEDTGFYQTALNVPGTASAHLGVEEFPYRVQGGSPDHSIAYHRMTLRFIEDQMPPIGTEVTDPDGLALMQSWIETLPPPQ